MKYYNQATWESVSGIDIAIGIRFLIATQTEYLLGEKGEVLFYQSGYKPGDEKIMEAKIVEILKVAQ